MNETPIDIEKFAEFEKDSVRFARMENQYLLCRIKGNIEMLFPGETNQKLLGIIVFRLKTGQLSLVANMERYHLTSGDILILNPGTKITGGQTLSKNVEWEILFVAVDFLKNLNMDFNTVNIPSLTNVSSPLLQMSREETDKILPYFNMLASNTVGGSWSIRLKIARSLFTALIYQLLEMFFDRLESRGGQDYGTPEASDSSKHRSRRPSNYVRDFIRLLHLNYMSERSAEFYASRLCITPKYLSIILKESTGRGVNDWINEFVLIEAKNLLKFSGKSVQQVAYSLNFPSQSSFGKYFKRLTGVSPTEYQKAD